jgi:hypothetical protein
MKKTQLHFRVRHSTAVGIDHLDRDVGVTSVEISAGMAKSSISRSMP